MFFLIIEVFSIIRIALRYVTTTFQASHNYFSGHNHYLARSLRFDLMNENNNNRLNQLFDSRDWSAVMAHLRTDEGRLQAAQSNTICSFIDLSCTTMKI